MPALLHRHAFNQRSKRHFQCFIYVNSIVFIYLFKFGIASVFVLWSPCPAVVIVAFWIFVFNASSWLMIHLIVFMSKCNFYSLRNGLDLKFRKKLHLILKNIWSYYGRSTTQILCRYKMCFLVEKQANYQVGITISQHVACVKNNFLKENGNCYILTYTHIAWISQNI